MRAVWIPCSHLGLNYCQFSKTWQEKPYKVIGVKNVGLPVAKGTEPDTQVFVERYELEISL